MNMGQDSQAVCVFEEDIEGHTEEGMVDVHIVVGIVVEDIGQLVVNRKLGYHRAMGDLAQDVLVVVG